MKPKLIHYFRWGTVSLDQLNHAAHRAVDMVEKGLVTIAQQIKSRFAVWGIQQPVFWASTVTGEAQAAFSALARQGGFFITPKLALLRQVD